MATKDKLDEFITGQILNQPLEEIIGERFGRYSKYIIQPFYQTSRIVNSLR